MTARRHCSFVTAYRITNENAGLQNMITTFFDHFFDRFNLIELYWITVGYFAFLYFGLGWIFWKTCRWMLKLGWVEKISDKAYSRRQLLFELKYSLYSILIFGFSSWPLAWQFKHHVIPAGGNSPGKILAGLVILTFWNEIHFYLIHRLLHLPFLIRRVHYIHHRSIVPSVFSVFSLHPVESALLSTVLITITPFYPFPTAALMLFPTVSILINFMGHSNYRLVVPEARKWMPFATRHNAHHGKAGQEFGFMMRFMDKLFTRGEHSSDTP